MYEKGRPSRSGNIFSLEKESFDVVVIGGGITGAGIARDASMRGLSVALVEKGDFSSGTSSRSSKMLHGGIRYLERMQLGLVLEANRERKMHCNFLSPHLTQSIPFMIPIYNWSPHSLATVSAGACLYSALSLSNMNRLKIYGRDKMQEKEPALEQENIRGGVMYTDTVMDDSRIVLENIKSAIHYGAVAVNYMIVRGFEKNSNGEILGVWVRDVSPIVRRLKKENLGSGKDILIRGKAVINATGPWSDYVRRLDNVNTASVLKPSKGVHLIFDNQALGNRRACVLTEKENNRIFFAIPWYGKTLVGTTDTEYDPRVDGDINNISPTGNDIDYLLSRVQKAFPQSNVGHTDILSAFAGLRPLAEGSKDAISYNISREHKILKSNGGLFSIVGGKYTTYRVMAKQMVNKVVEHLNRQYSSYGNLSRSITHKRPIVEAHKESFRMDVLEKYTQALGEDVVMHLQARYGLRWRTVADLSMQNEEWTKKIIPSQADILGEAAFAVKEEMALSLEDFFRRRTMLALHTPLTEHMDAIEQVNHTMFGKSAEEAISYQDVFSWQGLRALKNK